MWYVIQTTTGKEQELVEVIHKMLPASLYKDCFFLKRQLLKRLGGKWLEVTETLFPAYVFLELKEERVSSSEAIRDKSEMLFYQLKRIPEFTKLLGDSHGTFIPLEKEEVDFLRLLCENSDKKKDHLVPLTKLKLDGSGEVIGLEGPLEYFKEKIIRLNLRKRYALIELTIRGERQTAMLGIKIEKD